MRKLFLLLILAFSLLCPLTAQTEEVNEQYETFSWEPVAKVKQYGVAIEQYDSITDTWSEYKTVKTKETHLEVLFTPGTYRVSISTYNVMGRKSKGTDWVIFKILEENIPYLNERFLPKSRDWDAPVLFIKHNAESSVPSSDYITSPEGYAENTILIKGRNIFSPRTEFYLVPKDQNTEGGKEYINYCDDRKEQKLKVLNRNSKDFSVVVSYEPQELSSGYYSLQVRNTANHVDSIELLVLDDTVSQIQPAKGFVVDEHYKVNTFAEKNFGVYEFSVKGKGFNSTTEFYLVPTTGTYPYPFESQIERERVPVTVTGIYKQGAGNAQVTMSCELENLRTGYYNLMATNWDGSSSKFLCLVKKPFNNDYTKKIKKLKSKFNKKTEYVDVTIQDDKLSPDKTYTLVSEYETTVGSNKRVKLSLSPSGKALTGQVAPDTLMFAKYALLIEDEFSYDVVYCQIDTSLRISETKMTESAIEKAFLRPVDNDLSVTLDDDEISSIVYYDNDVKMKKYTPLLFSNIHFSMSLLEDKSIALNGELDLLHYGIFTLAGGYEYIEARSEQNAFATLRIAYFNNYFMPYIGAGIGQNLIVPDDGITGFDSVLDMLKDKDQTFVFAQAGINFLTVFDVRYNLVMNNAFGSPYFTEGIYFGFSYPLRPYKFKRKPVTQSAMITKSGFVDGSTLLEKERKIPVDKVEFLKSTSVGGLAGYNDIEEIGLGPTVQVIEESAFADCENLSIVTFDGYAAEDVPLTIKGSAFAHDTKIESIRLPYRTKVVQPGAFAGWTNGQMIILEWSKDDPTERDLSGLEHCSATVLYKYDEVFKGSFNTPFDNPANWCPVNELKMKNVSVHLDESYVLGISLKGYAPSWYRSELDTWINQESPTALVRYIQSGDKIKFYVQGDGNKYDFVLTTEDGGYFYYRFATKKDKVTKVEIPYNKLTKYSFSSQKKLDVDNIKMCCIVPMCKGEWNNAAFFNFEVIAK